MAVAGEVIDMEQCQKLATLVDKLTTSGKPILPEEEMKSLKRICRQSDAYVKHCFYLIMTQLEKDHSEIRLSCFLIVDELFNRSHCFRDLLLKDFQNFLELTLETDPELQLPPPKQAADVLKRKAMKAIHQWHSKFGEAYKKLSLGYNFLKHCKKIDFEGMEARTEAERRQAERDVQKAQEKEKQLVHNALQQMRDAKEELKQTLLQAENCLSLLLPEPETFDINGLKSPDPHRTANPWQPHRRMSLDRRKSTDSSKIKNSKRRLSANKHQSNSLTPQENQSNVEVKSESLDSCALNGENNHDTTSSQENVGKKELPQVKVKEEMGHCSKDSVEVGSDSDDFQEITDSSEESSGREEEEEYEDRVPTSGAMEMVRNHGMHSRQTYLSIDLPPDEVHIEETEDNEDIINALKDSVQLCQNKFLPSLQKWIEIFTKAGKQDLIRRALDVKNVISNMTEKVAKFKFYRNRNIKQELSTENIKAEVSDESDDDFEEVKEKEGFEPQIPEQLREEYGLLEKVTKPATQKEWSLKNHDEEDQDPTSHLATLKKWKQSLDNDSTSAENPGSEPGTSSSGSDQKPKAGSTSSSTSEELRKRAPHVPFNTDLAHWGQKIEAPLVVKFESSSRFWLPKETSDSDIVDKGALSEMTSRMISFTGKFEPVKHECRAPLPSGKLCPRRDRFKCPFHGKIIPRDPVGQPINPEDRLREEENKEKKQQEGVPDWEDPDLQQEIQAATGIDVSKKRKGKGKKSKQKYPDLTDISPQPKTSRGRLHSKILSKKAIKRVSSAMDALDRKRHRDKFGNQFNYALKQKP